MQNDFKVEVAAVAVVVVKFTGYIIYICSREIQVGNCHVVFLKENLPRWWFQIFFYVHPYLGK